MKNILQQPKTAERYRLEKFRKRAGISVVETMVALALLAFFITGSCKILFAQRKLADKSRGHYSAINIAKNRIELCRTFEFGQMNDFVEQDVMVDLSGVADIDGKFRRSTALSVVSSNIVEMVVTVEIRNRMSLDFDGENEELSTYFAEYLTEESSVGSGIGINSN
ncbi:MAG: hypothetical protein V3V05_01540 [Pontiella sp.]